MPPCAPVINMQAGFLQPDEVGTGDASAAIGDNNSFPPALRLSMTRPPAGMPAGTSSAGRAFLRSRSRTLRGVSAASVRGIVREVLREIRGQPLPNHRM